MARILCFVFALPVVASAFTLSPDRMNMGQRIGNAIAALGKNLQATSTTNEGTTDAFLKQLADQFGAKQPVLTNPGVAAAVARANRLATSSVAAADELCSRDWAQICPDGWRLVDEMTCSAPASYQGACGTIQKIEASVAAKTRFVDTCKAPWPCKEAEVCAEGRDYEACPAGWTLLKDGFCRRASTAPSQCPGLYNFAAMDIVQKQELALVCGLIWNCRESCKRDFSATCPEGWDEISGLCIAPPTYAGLCGYSLNTSTLDEVQKQIFASKCAVQFPCIAHKNA
jgi:CPW-WPC domain-containing protein